MELEGNSNSVTSAAFLGQLRERHTKPLIVIWDNSPAHRGDALRTYLTTPGLNLRLVNLPSYSPDFNADEAIWGWARAEATAKRHNDWLVDPYQHVIALHFEITNDFSGIVKRSSLRKAHRGQNAFFVNRVTDCSPIFHRPSGIEPNERLFHRTSAIQHFIVEVGNLMIARVCSAPEACFWS